MQNMELWNSVFRTDPNYTKGFSRAGGFKGTAISPMYLVFKATEAFGPIGIGWGFEETDSKIVNGIWFSKVSLWYKHNGATGKVEQWGATVLEGTNRNGSFVDEEAAKKSVTDGMTKCLSYLGFAGDVHMGLFDDSKYVSEVRAEIAAEERKAEESRRAAEAAKKAPASIKASTPDASIAPEDKELRRLWAQITDVDSTLKVINSFREPLGGEAFGYVLSKFGMTSPDQLQGKKRGDIRALVQCLLLKVRETTEQEKAA